MLKDVEFLDNLSFVLLRWTLSIQEDQNRGSKRKRKLNNNLPMCKRKGWHSMELVNTLKTNWHKYLFPAVYAASALSVIYMFFYPFDIELALVALISIFIVYVFRTPFLPDKTMKLSFVAVGFNALLFYSGIQQTFVVFLLFTILHYCLMTRSNRVHLNFWRYAFSTFVIMLWVYAVYSLLGGEIGPFQLAYFPQYIISVSLGYVMQIFLSFFLLSLQRKENLMHKVFKKTLYLFQVYIIYLILTLILMVTVSFPSLELLGFVLYTCVAVMLSIMFKQHHDLYEQVYTKAYYDIYTGLPNSYSFEDALQREAKKQALLNPTRSKHTAGYFTLAIITIDRFRNINNMMGSSLSEKVTVFAGQRIQKILPHNVQLYILNHSEFAILASGIDKKQISLIIETIVQRFREPVYVDGQDISLTLSIGVCTYPTDTNTFSQLRQYCNMALSQAHIKGGDAVVYFTEEMKQAYLQRIMLESDLSRALDQGELEVYFQPQIDTKQMRIVSAEALLRWKHEQLGYIPPSTFIPIAESSGLIIPIGEWVLRTVCHQLKTWRDSGYPLIEVGVNLSSRQFEQKDFADQVTKIIMETGIDPQSITLELTESIAIGNEESVVEQMNELKKLGLKFSLDDFGTGYSSMYYLQSLPINAVKIDRSFIQNLTLNDKDKEIVRALIMLAHNLGLEVIAEGIELPEQMNHLKELRCDRLQGYLFGKPAPCLEFSAMLKEEVVAIS